MASLEESNCHSLSDSFSLYERYLRSFNVVDNFVEENNQLEPADQPSSLNGDYDSSNSRGNIDLSAVGQTNALDKQSELIEPEYNLLSTAACDILDKEVYLDVDNCTKLDSPSTSQAASLLDSSTTAEHCTLNDKFGNIDAHLLSEDSKSEIFKQPIFITSTMENSNNAVDSVPMFRDVRPAESVFKLPISELSFNGTLKHVQKLKPIVDPITALSSTNVLVNLDEKSEDHVHELSNRNDDIASSSDVKSDDNRLSSASDDQSSYEKSGIDKTTESTGDSQYEEFNVKKMRQLTNEECSNKWNSEQSYSSLEASFDSGVRSPDIFSDEDEEVQAPAPEPFWGFLKDFEAFDKRRVRKTERVLQGVLPPPSVTILKTDVATMLKKYYCFLPAFLEDNKPITSDSNSTTPTKRVSFVHIPTGLGEPSQDVAQTDLPNSTTYHVENAKSRLSKDSTKSDSELDTSTSDRTVELKICTEKEAKETQWPDVLKCTHPDIYYNVTKYSEQFECLALRYGERFVGAETDSSVCVHSGGLQSPSSASKRKALRLAQAKSPGRRLSHLARRRQTFCSAATINEKAQSSAAKMILIDKKKLINTSEKRSPRKRRTPGKKTPVRKTPGKKTPAKTPKTHSGGSSRKKAMRRLLMDTETLTRSQPSRETLKRALFISPEHRKVPPPAPSTSVPNQVMKSRRALFGSPVTKSNDGLQSDQFLKRKRDTLDDTPETSRSKIAKSLSFGGDSLGGSQPHSLSRRASESFLSKNKSDLNENHKQKLLWAVSVALRAHGWGLARAGFRDKAAALARLTRRLLALAPHARRLAAPNASTSETMLKIARQYAFAIVQGRTVEDCYEEEKAKLASEPNKVSGYISASAYQQMKAKSATTSTFTSQIKENSYIDGSIKQEQPRSNSKNILQDKLVNIDTSSSSSSGMSLLDKGSLPIFKSNSMPSFEEAAKMRARRQISFDNIEFPKR